MVRQDGGGWKIEVADDWQRPMRGGSSSRGTGEPCLGDTGAPLLVCLLSSFICFFNIPVLRVMCTIGACFDGL